MKEASTRCETSHNAGGKVAATNKLIKTFCQKYTLVQFFEYNIKSIIALKRLFSQILTLMTSIIYYLVMFCVICSYSSAETQTQELVKVRE